MTPPTKRYRCRFCGRELPAWLPVAQEPWGPMLVHHLSAMHPAEVGPYLERMATEDIATVEEAMGTVGGVKTERISAVNRMDLNERERREIGGAFMAKATHDWAKLDPRIDQLKTQGWTDTQIAKELNIGRQTLVDHLRSRESVHLSTLQTTDITEVPQDTPGHPGTLEGYQEVIEDLQESVPEVAHLVTEKNTDVFDLRHVALMDRYAQEHHLDVKEVMFLALEEFFQRRGYPNA